MPMNCWLLQGQLIIKEVAYATNQVLCQASFVWLIHYECQGVSLKVSGVRCRVSGVEVSGVRCRVSGTINIEAETCWSEAAAGNTETSVTVEPQDIFLDNERRYVNFSISAFCYTQCEIGQPWRDGWTIKKRSICLERTFP
jgi:hypothetical protein